MKDTLVCIERILDELEILAVSHRISADDALAVMASEAADAVACYLDELAFRVRLRCAGAIDTLSVGADDAAIAQVRSTFSLTADTERLVTEIVGLGIAGRATRSAPPLELSFQEIEHRSA